MGIPAPVDRMVGTPQTAAGAPQAVSKVKKRSVSGDMGVGRLLPDTEVVGRRGWAAFGERAAPVWRGR